MAEPAKSGLGSILKLRDKARRLKGQDAGLHSHIFSILCQDRKPPVTYSRQPAEQNMS